MQSLIFQFGVLRRSSSLPAPHVRSPPRPIQLPLAIWPRVTSITVRAGWLLWVSAGLRRLRGWLSQCIHRGRNDFLRAPAGLPWREAHATPKSLRVAHPTAPSHQVNISFRASWRAHNRPWSSRWPCGGQDLAQHGTPSFRACARAGGQPRIRDIKPRPIVRPCQMAPLAGETNR